MPKTLLLADDSVTIQKVVGISFANEDIELVTVDNGDDAVDRARELRPDIILADVVMPGKTGYQVCEAIKDDPELAHIPVVLLTGTFETFDETRAAQVRADGHITKPFEAQALVDQVNSRLAQASPVPPVVNEPDGLGLTDMVTPAEAADQSYDLFEDEVTAPSGVSTSPATTTILMDDGAGEDASAQTWVEDFGAADSTPSLESAPSLESGAQVEMGGDTHPSAPFETPEADPVLASGDPIEEADRSDGLFEAAAPATGAALFEDSAPISDDAGTIFDDAPSASGEQTIFDQPPMADSGVSYSSISEPSSPVDDAPPAEAAAPAPDQTEAFLLDEEVGGQAYVGEAGDDLFDEATDDGATRLLDTTMPPASVASATTDSLGDDFGGSEAAPMDSATASAYDVSSSEIEEPQTWAPAPASPVILPSEPGWPETEASEAGDAAALGAPSPAETVAIFPDTPSASAEEPDAIHVGIPLDQTDASAPELIHRDIPSALSPLMEKELRDGIEKLAWDAFGDLAERIVKDAVERIEQVAWEVIPKMAETLVREEIRKLKENSGE